MDWSKIDLNYLAYPSCTRCNGRGEWGEHEGSPLPCRCALRAMFRVCYERFRACVESGRFRSRVSFERSPQGRTNRGCWGRKDEEYLADFELVARRLLDPWRYKIFRFHYILGADASLCCRRLGLSRGAFFHAAYRIEEILGEAFATLEPYALYPPRDYFSKRLTEPVRATPQFVPQPIAPRRGRPRSAELLRNVLKIA
ncbi:MAG: hypothetical protein GC160_24590 [Acidobacteria bacterium]|nr:hypothetical protein [Acidobacteriota bacterium]